MQLIPVIDLKRGKVVRAHQGDRERYQPVSGSKICSNAEPASVAAALISAFHCEAIYVADLDAIEGTGNHNEHLEAIGSSYPDTAVWLDAGFRAYLQLARWRRFPNVIPVIGSETVLSMGAYIEILTHFPNAILSLDYRNETFLGPTGLFERPSAWPGRIIHLNLAHVGGNGGPDIAGLRDTMQKAAGRMTFLGGGIRSLDDWRTVAQTGAAGALLATALHNGAITPTATRESLS